MSLPGPVVEQSWVTKVFTGPALATILVALIGQAAFSIVYQIVNNEQQNAALLRNETAIKDLKDSINDMRTPLSIRVFKLEDNLTNVVMQNAASHLEMNKRIDQMDTIGTRALAIVSNNQLRVMSQLDRLAERIMLTDKRIGEADVAPTLIKLQAQIDVMSQNIKRIEEILRERK